MTAFVFKLDYFKEPKGAIKIVLFLLELFAFAAVASWSKSILDYKDIDGGEFFMFVHVCGWLLMGLFIFIYAFLLDAIVAKVSFYYSIEIVIHGIWCGLALISSAIFAYKLNKFTDKYTRNFIKPGPMEFGVAMGFIAFIVFGVSCYYIFKEVIAAGGFQGKVRSGSAAVEEGHGQASAPAPAAPVPVDGETTVPF